MARLGIDMQKLDYVVAGGLTVALELELWLTAEQPHHKIGFALLGPLLAAGVAVRRRFPLLVGMLASVAVIPYPPGNFISWGVAWMCDLYALAAWVTGRRFWVGLLVFELAGIGSLHDVKASDAVPFMIVATIVILLVHVVVGDRERRLRVAERERDVAAREAVVEERARIARELHDVIAHHVSMIVLQAGAERRVLNGSDGSTRQVLQTIEQTGRSALTEMRRLLGMLRSEGPEPLLPQPSLDDVPLLVTQLREAGLPVDLTVEGERRELPVGLELSAYRIVQEALTNALKHAGDARARVSVRYGPDSLELEVVDDGPGTAAPVSGSGHGLVGMRERVALYGGRLEAGRGANGGFGVRALLPIR